MRALWQLSVGNLTTEGIPLPVLAQAKFNQQGKETLMFMLLLSQSFCTNEDSCLPLSNRRQCLLMAMAFLQTTGQHR